MKDLLRKAFEAGELCYQCDGNEGTDFETWYNETYIKQLHKPVVSVKQPDHKTIRAAAFEYAKWQTPPEWEQERKYAAKDFLAGAQWALSQVAGATAKGEERKE
jgi:hypothetical protein